MQNDKLRKKFPGGILRERHPFYMFDAINEIPACIKACLTPEFLAPIRSTLRNFQPTKVFTLGCGTSLNAAEAAAYFLQKNLSVPARAFDAYDFEMDPPVDLDDRSLVIAISATGNSITTCLAVEYAAQWGAFTVGVSTNPDSRLARTAKLSLVDPLGHDIPLGKIRSYPSSILLAMLAGVCTQSEEDITHFVTEMNVLAELMKASAEQWQQLAKQTAAQLPAAQTRHIVTGFGCQKPNADEIRLKLLEVLGESATSFGLEEFAHGPSACFKDDLCVIMLQTDERTLEKSLHFAAGVAISPAHLVVITDSPEANWPEKSFILPLPKMSEPGLLGGFPAIMAAQYFFYFLAIHKGLNPDVNLEDTHPELGDIYSFYFPPGTH
jgi:fructoselysine-6-P-deglycase FrlB-like protein